MLNFKSNPNIRSLVCTLRQRACILQGNFKNPQSGPTFQDFVNAANCYEQLTIYYPEEDDYKVYYAQSLYQACLYEEAMKVTVRNSRCQLKSIEFAENTSSVPPRYLSRTEVTDRRFRSCAAAQRRRQRRFSWGKLHDTQSHTHSGVSCIRHVMLLEPPYLVWSCHCKV